MAEGIETTNAAAPVTDSGTTDNTDVGSTDAAVAAQADPASAELELQRGHQSCRRRARR